MAIVHHANYVRFLELVRVVWMDEHDRPYREYAAEGLHFATTRVEIDYRRSASFDDHLDISAWMEWVRGVSLGMAYQIHRGDELSRPPPPNTRWSTSTVAPTASPPNAARSSAAPDPPATDP